MSRAASTARSRPDTRREELLEAAQRVIQRSGFASATISEITREAGASLGLAHYHFGSKDDLVAEALDVAVARGPARAGGDRAARRPGARAAGRLPRGLGLGGPRELADVDRRVGPGGAHRRAARLARRLRPRLARGARRRPLRRGARGLPGAAPDPAETAALLVAALDGIGVHTALHPEDVPPAAGRRVGAPARRARARRDAARGAAAARGARRRRGPRDPPVDPRPRPRRRRARAPRGARRVPGGGARRLAGGARGGGDGRGPGGNGLPPRAHPVRRRGGGALRARSPRRVERAHARVDRDRGRCGRDRGEHDAAGGGPGERPAARALSEAEAEALAS